MSDFIAKVRGGIFSLKCRYTRRGITFGRGLKLHCKLEVVGDGSVSLGDNCAVYSVKGEDKHVIINTLNREATIVIGNSATLIGARISARSNIEIGNNFTIEESLIMDSDFHSIGRNRAIQTGIPVGGKDLQGVHIGNKVSIGARCVLCKGVTIGDNVLVMPGSIINKSLPADTIACGNPAKPLRNA